MAGIPAYDSETEGVYVFTPILPDGYALADGVTLPEITVTVVADDTQAEELHALLKLLRALPDPEEYLTYDEVTDAITEHEEMIDEAQLEEARAAADAYLDRYPDAGTADDTDSAASTHTAAPTTVNGTTTTTDSAATTPTAAPGTANGTTTTTGSAATTATKADSAATTHTAAPATAGSAATTTGSASTLDTLLKRLTALEHIRDTETDCMDFDCPYHYPRFVQARMQEDEVPELLTLEDLVEDYGVEEPTAQQGANRARAYGAARAASVTHPQTLMLTDDNENNAHTGTADGDIDIEMNNSLGEQPIELSFMLSELPTQSAYLAVKAYDVDEDYGEHDYVYLNDDIYQPMNLRDGYNKPYNNDTIGYLAGTNNTWNTTVLQIPLEKLVKGKNVISITIASGWVVKVDWMQLILDGGAADANIEEFSLKLNDSEIDGENVTVYADVTIKQKGTKQYATEYTLSQTATGNALDACFGEASKEETVELTLPLDSPSGLYCITGVLKDPETEEIKAVDQLIFYFTQGSGLGPVFNYTLTPDTLTNQNVVIRASVQDIPEQDITGAAVSPASKTASANGVYDFIVTYKDKGVSKSLSCPVNVDNIDKVAPVIAYEPITIREGQSLEEVEALFAAALSVTDDRKVAENPLQFTVPSTISSTPGTKSITVTAADAAGNTATKSCTITILPDPIKLTMGELKAVTGSKGSYTLNAVLENTGGGTITETGFVWGVIASPTLDVNSGSVKTASVVKIKGGKLSANATGLLSGVEYYVRAYAKVAADGTESIAYSDSKKFGIGIPAYGTFSVSGPSGSTFTIRRTGGTDGKQTVYYRTVNGSAIGGTHFTHAAGSLTFADGETSKTVTVTEKGVTTAYGGKTATSYANADRTYSLEIYRVEGGGEIDQNSRSKTRTMSKSSSYTIDRTLYTTEKSKIEVAVTSGTNGKRIADTTSKQGGEQTNVSFLTNRYNETNYNTNSNFSTYYTNASQKAYLNATAGGWYYRYVLTAYEYEDGYEYAYFGTKALADKHYDLDGGKKGAAISGIAGQLWMCNFLQGQKDAVGTYHFPDTRTGGGENSYKPYKSSGTPPYSYNSNTYVKLGLDDTCYLYFGATGADTDIWYVDGLTGYALVYDEKEPTCIGVAPMAGGTYLPGDPITVALVFDEIVDSANSNLTNVAINTNVGTLTYAGGADTNVLYFTGTVSSTASLSGSSALKVTSITNSGNIKDMCNLAGTASTFTSSSTNVEVDAATPNVTITAKTSGSLPRHEALVTATGAASIQYAWTQDTAMPAYGWQAVTSGTTLTGSYGTAGTTEVWYLHVLATASSGASTHKYQSFSFKQPAITGVSVRAGTTTSAADVSDVWKSYKYIVVQYNGTQTSGTTLAFEGPKTSSQSITAASGTKYLQVTQNGAYTITLTDSYGNVLSEHVEVKKIDAEKPTVTIQSGSSTAADVVHNTVTAVVNPQDAGGSGVAKVEYAWTNTTSTPSSSAWSTLSVTADGSYQTAYTATETTKTAKYLHVRVTDGAGNVSTVVRSGPYQVIKPATGAALPTITVTGNPTAWTKSAKLTWTAKAGTGTGAGTIKAVYVPDSNAALTTTTGTVNVTKNGNYMFTVMDSNGNTVTEEVLVTKIDQDAPKLDAITAAGNTTGGKTGTITLTGATDNCSVVLDAKGNYSSIGGSGIKTRQYQLTGESGWTSFSGNSFTVNRNGTYTVRLTDQLGNYREYSVDMTDIDATAPEVTCVVNATPNAKSGWYTASTVPVVLTFADQAGAEGGTPSGIQSVYYQRVTDNTKAPSSYYSVGTSAVNSGTYTCNFTSSYNGSYYLYYKVTDKKGNVAEGFSDFIKKDSVGSLTFSGPAKGQPVSTGLAMNAKLTYGPAGGYLTAGTSASSERIATLDMYAETGSKIKETVYTAKNTGTNYFRYYRYAMNGETGTSSSSWSFYVRQIDFNTQGGSAVESQLIWTTQASSSTSTTVQCAVTEPAAPTRTGYTFSGWYTDAACTAGKEFDFSKQVRVNTTLYAKWTENTYRVTYHLTNADGNAYTPDASVQTYTYGQGLTLPVPACAKEGFTFHGWYENAAYTGTAYTSIAKTATGDKEYYAYYKDTQAPQFAGIGLVNATNENAEDGWYRSGRDSGSAAVVVTGCSDNVNVTSVSVKVDKQSYTQTGVSMSSTGTYQYALQEGEHSYTFLLADAAGNETTSETKTVKYDGTKPTIGEITCEKKVSGFLDWIIGQESLIIHIPVSDSLSGVKRLTYTETRITAAGETSETKTVSLSGRTGQQTVELKLDADWKGKISDLVCTDKAGNVSDSKTVGTSGSIIVEDKPPVIKVTEADLTGGTPKPGNAVSTAYYENDAAPTLYVSVQDESAERMGISAGIETISYAIGGAEQTVSGSFADALTGSYAFTISLDGYTGVIDVAVKAIDHAGNTATEHVTVRIKGEEETPDAKPDYPRDSLGGLSAGSIYALTVDGETYTCTADGDGYLPFILTDGVGTTDLCGHTIQIVKKGDGENTQDSQAQTLTITARPPAIPADKTETEAEIVQEAEDAVLRLKIDDQQDKTKEYSTDGGATWKEVPKTDAGEDVIQNLAPGNVVIRVKADEQTPHGYETTIEIKPSANTITAVFELNYEGADASDAPTAQTGLKYKSYLQEPEKPQRAGYDFVAWYKEADCKTAWRFTDAEDGSLKNIVGDIIDKSKEDYKNNYTVVDGAITVKLYAGWRENVQPKLAAVLTDHTDEKDEAKWHPAPLAIALTYSDNVGVTKLYGRQDDDAYEELSIAASSADGSDADGNMQYRFTFDAVEEGDHTYTFMAVDAAGNQAETSLRAKLDRTNPVLGEAAFNEGYQNLWDWIIRKDKLIIRIPVTETGSGIDTVTYTLTSADGAAVTTGEADVKKAAAGETGDATATIGIAPDYKGTVAIVAQDQAGNRSTLKMIGADGSGIAGVLIEDNAPEITVLADRGVDDAAATQASGMALADAYYNTAPKLIVTAEDRALTGSTAVTAGLSRITWKIDDEAENPVSADFDAQLTTTYRFTINALEDRSGVFTVTVKAVDQAGNENEKMVTVRVKEREPVPEPDIDYIQEKLTGLTPGAGYGVGDEVVAADGQGCIDIREEWFGGSIQMRTKGKESTLDSEDVQIALAARPAAPDVDKKSDETIKGKRDGVLTGADTTMEYSADGGKTWTQVQADAIADGDMTGLPAGGIRIRVRATRTAPHGEYAEVTIGTGRALTVTFVTNGGSPLAPMTGKSWNDTLTVPDAPVKEGYALVGWYRESDLSERAIWHFAAASDDAAADRLTDDITLYAKWKDSAKPKLSAALMDDKDAGTWYRELAYLITYADNVGTEKLYVKCDHGDYRELSVTESTENGINIDGDTEYRLLYADLTEGEHTYTFRAVDAAGNEAQTEELRAKLDTTKPVLGHASYSEGYRNLWNWIIHKESMIITVPITETGSGIDRVEYTLIPADEQTEDGDADGALNSIRGEAAVQEPSGGDGDAASGYTATISIAPDFKGTITIAAMDKAGNRSETKMIGTDGGGIKGVIVEDNAPSITILADRFESDETGTQADGTALSENYYRTAPELIVKVADDAADGSRAVVSGLASVTWRIDDGEAHTDDGNFDAAMQSDYRFQISGLAGESGVHTVTVTAVDQAGNIAEETVTVRIMGRETKPAPEIDYMEEKLTGLKPDTDYVVQTMYVTTDSSGALPIPEDWHRTTISIYQPGDHVTTLDSETAQVSIPSRMETPDAKIDYRREKLTGLEADKPYLIDGAVVTTDTSGSTTIQEEQMNGENHEIARERVGNMFRSKPQPLLIPTRPAAPEGVTGVDASRKGAADGKLQGLDDAMEYRAEKDSAWIAVAGEQAQADRDSTEEEAEDEEEDVPKDGGLTIDGLSEGTYLVRYRASDYAFAGNTAQVEIAWKKAPAKPGNEEPDPDDGDNTPPTDDNPPTEDTQTGDDTPPTGGTPPADDKKPDGTDDPKPGDDTNPRDDTKPSGGTRPSDDTKPSGGTQPDGDTEPGKGTTPGDGTTPGEDTNPSGGTNPPIGDNVTIIPVIIENGRIIIPDGVPGGTSDIVTGSEPGGTGTEEQELDDKRLNVGISAGERIFTGTTAGRTTASTVLQIASGNGTGTVIVTVVCEEQAYTAGVADTVAVANAVLNREQMQLVQSGETIEIRIDVKDISGSVPQADKETIENGIEAYKDEIPGLVLGMYIDISMYIKIGDGGWDTIVKTDEPVEVVIGIPEELQADGRAYYIIRAHEGAYSLMEDADAAQETITISTDLFSSYAIAYQQIDETNADGDAKCGLCHICPTFLGICCFIWLAVAVAAALMIVILITRRRKRKDGDTTQTKA